MSTELRGCSKLETLSLTRFQNTEKRVEITRCSRVFLMNFKEILWSNTVLR